MPDTKPIKKPPANDNPISLTDLAKAAGIDEDTLLKRLAAILSRPGKRDV
jgi:hypothetical protein